MLEKLENHTSKGKGKEKYQEQGRRKKQEEIYLATTSFI